MRRAAAVLLITLAAAPAAHAGTTLGVYGDPGRFHDQTGQRSQTKQKFVAWDSSVGHLERVLDRYGPVPLVAVQPKNATDREVLTPRGIARGRGDAYLMRLNEAYARFGKRAYIRPLPEMNGHWNVYCAYDTDGSRRGPSHSQAAFKDAFRRIYVIVHGGSREAVNRKLRRFGMPGIGRDLPRNRLVRVVWNPQGFGSPNVPGNMPRAYWPGKHFVDVVGNDLYDMNGRPTWAAAKALYRAHPHKPYAFPEWGLWGIDDPGFVRRMARFVRTHDRVELISFWSGGPGSIFDLASKPASRRAYRRSITPLGG